MVRETTCFTHQGGAFLRVSARRMACEGQRMLTLFSEVVYD